MLSHLFRFAANRLSPAGTSAHLTILIYHRILSAPDPLQPEILDAEAFDKQLKLVKSLFQVLPLPQAVAALKTGRLPARSACITFDDGYADNLLCALPVLQQNAVSATFFIATDYLDGGRMFNDTVIEAVRRAPAGYHDLRELGLESLTLSTLENRQRSIANLLSQIKYLPQSERSARVTALVEQLSNQPLPNNLMLTTAQLLDLHRAGMTIGAHTASHPILETLTDAEALADIARGKLQLEAILGEEIQLFAYPNGKPNVDYTRRDVELVQSLGFLGAVSTAWGAAQPSDDPYQLPRFSPWASQPLRMQAQMLRNLKHPITFC
ncbi:polysaccharide deacetylase family protein [Chromatium okenii]|uniref:polysaccharide deacetylase family protein n=1 Tax=Chromatium okenii TaxID=61644 RepID=UPI0026EF204B|nr:polysaccharide deacetylase family protein [Chromatium okenii]MBV5308105.1 polysaccharide deacetylase family protein [Chromatium okenii]